MPSAGSRQARRAAAQLRSRTRRRSGAVALGVLVLVVVVASWGSKVVPKVIRAAAGISQSGTAVDPSMFASGACMTYPPTSGNRHRVVFLDAGHGGLDPGAQGVTQSGKTIYEADLTLPVAQDTMALLRASGYQVVLSRTRNENVARLAPYDTDGTLLSLQGVHDDIAARDICANDAHASALVGIYFDAGGPANAGSLTAYDTARRFATQNEQLAQLLDRDTVAAMNAQGWQIPDAGAQSDAQLGSLSGDPSQGGLAALAAQYNHLMLLGPAEAGYFSTPSEMPGSVIEPLFITDAFEGTIAASSQGQNVIARGIATAVEQFLDPSAYGDASTTTAVS
ncbi:MAG: N-acetylmuramoyl-L-alanine amidase family protein [Acidimicrobiales bacterium]